jgi:hypothetical protein
MAYLKGIEIGMAPKFIDGIIFVMFYPDGTK